MESPGLLEGDSDAGDVKAVPDPSLFKGRQLDALVGELPGVDVHVEVEGVRARNQPAGEVPLGDVDHHELLQN